MVGRRRHDCPARLGSLEPGFDGRSDHALFVFTAEEAQLVSGGWLSQPKTPDFGQLAGAPELRRVRLHRYPGANKTAARRRTQRAAGFALIDCPANGQPMAFNYIPQQVGSAAQPTSQPLS